MRSERWVGPDNPKVVLVLPPRDGRHPSLESYPPTPPTGLSIVAWETMRRIERSDEEIGPKIEIRFPDRITEEFVRECAEADVLGITDWFHTHAPAMELVRRVKKINPSILVVVGGVNAKNLWRQILLNNPGVDLVCNGEGENVLWRILVGEDFSSIPNLCYRTNGGFEQTVHKETNLGKIGTWDFGYCNRAELDRWEKAIEQDPTCHAPAGVPFTIGCPKRDTDGACSFCSCVGRYQEAPAEQIVRQIRRLQSQGVKSFFATGDDLTSEGLLRDIKRCASGKLADNLWIYANPARVTKQCAALLKDIGVYSAFMGFETAVDSISKKAKRPAGGLSVVEEAARNLTAVGVAPSTGVMLGLPGETVETAKVTAKALLGLVERNPSIKRVLVSVAVPFAGSPWYRNLCKDEQIAQSYLDHTGKILNDDDDPDYMFLLQCSLERSGTELEPILAIAQELRAKLSEMGVEVGSFGAIDSMARS